MLILNAAYTSLTMLPALGLSLHSVTGNGESGQLLSAQTAFAAMTLFQIVSTSIQDGTAHILALMVGLGSVQRIESFLNQNSWTESRNSLGNKITKKEKVDESSVDEKAESDLAVKFQKVSARLAEDSDMIVKEATFDVPLHGLTIIVGPTGSGKSTMLRVALGDLTPVSGTVNIRSPHIAFCDQTPWIANISIRDNIVGASHFNEERYRMAIDACALDHDLQEIAGGDQHLCGLNGQSVSGGQKVRIVSTPPI